MALHCRAFPLACATVLASFLAASAARAQIGSPQDIGTAQANAVAAPLPHTITMTTTQDVPAGASILVLSLRQASLAPSTPFPTTCSDGAGHTYSTDVSV